MQPNLVPTKSQVHGTALTSWIFSGTSGSLEQSDMFNQSQPFRACAPRALQPVQNHKGRGQLAGSRSTHHTSFVPPCWSRTLHEVAQAEAESN